MENDLSSAAVGAPSRREPGGEGRERESSVRGGEKGAEGIAGRETWELRWQLMELGRMRTG